MVRLFAPALLVALAGAAALSACSPSQPPETPESPAKTAEPAPTADPAPTAAPEPATTAMPGSLVKSGDSDGKAPSLEAYELTPSDCDALGKQYGLVARADQMAALSPKLSEKQRSATAEQVDRVVSKLEESWMASCHSTLVNKAVDHKTITCALASKTVKQFDVCLNGEAGTPQAAQKPAKPGKKK